MSQLEYEMIAPVYARAMRDKSPQPVDGQRRRKPRTHPTNRRRRRYLVIAFSFLGAAYIFTFFCLAMILR